MSRSAALEAMAPAPATRASSKSRRQKYRRQK
jgi:hypothetical protein